MTATATSRSAAESIRRVEVEDGGCRLVGEATTHTVACRPRADLARRWSAQVRRVDGVVIDVGSRTAVAAGSGRRLPFRRRIPVSIALALAIGGTPTKVVGVSR